MPRSPCYPPSNPSSRSAREIVRRPSAIEGAKPANQPTSDIEARDAPASADSSDSAPRISLPEYAALLRSGALARRDRRDRLVVRLLAGGAITAPAYDGLEQDLAALARTHVLSDVVSDATGAMPALLSAIPDRPLALFCDGDVATLGRPAVAIIGARRASRFGAAFAEQLGRDLALAGLTVVSGLAYGIDAAAHRGALMADGIHGSGGGATVAVLGSGLEYIYPASNRALAERIRRNGCLVSEYLPYTPPARHRFPERNRIVSGLSSAVIVVEAGERSGSLITARLALEQGRDVYAVPGPPGNELSAGCHRLIRQGAALVTSAEQVLAELPGWVQPDALVPASAASDEHSSRLSEKEQSLLSMLSSEPRPLEWLAEQAPQPTSELLGTLTGLELAGFVEATLHGYIRRPSR